MTVEHDKRHEADKWQRYTNKPTVTNQSESTQGQFRKNPFMILESRLQLLSSTKTGGSVLR